MTSEKRRRTRAYYARQVAELIGLEGDAVKKSYLSKKDWRILLAEIITLQKTKEKADADETRNIES